MKKLRIRFILAAMGSMFAVLAAIVIGMNVLSYLDVIDNSDRELSRIVANGGIYPQPGAERMQGGLASGGAVSPGGGQMGSGEAGDPGESSANAPQPLGDGDVAPQPPGSDGETPPPLPDGASPGEDPAPGDEMNPMAADGDGSVSDEGMRGLSAESPYETRYFTVYFYDDEVVATNMDNIAAISDEDARAKAVEILEEGSERGFADDTYRYVVADVDISSVEIGNADAVQSGGSAFVTEDGSDEVGDSQDGDSGEAVLDGNVTRYLYNKMVVFVNCEKRLDAFRTSLWISVIVSVVGALVVLMLVILTSKLVFRPVAATERKQKQFLTDASHELKTPLAIIEANTELIELESGETKWTESTRHQVERLTGLVEQMVALTRLDEEDFGGENAEFSLSDAVQEVVENFMAPAEVAGKDISLDVADGVKIRANEKNIRQLIGILLDNAVKYATPDTTIEISLTTKGKRAHIRVYNRADGVEKGDNDILFERFYRADASRNSQTGGSGIGLSVAKSITEQAKGKIHAESDDGESLRIDVTLPM